MAKVLLVEDDNNLREIYQARLTAEGYDISTAQNGEEALSVAKQVHPDLIISDVMMPRISGFEMLDILRNTDELKHTKVIMLTALGQADDRDRAQGLGADKYLVKSQVTLEDIVNCAHDLLAGTASSPAAPGIAPDPAHAAPSAAGQGTPLGNAPAAASDTGAAGSTASQDKILQHAAPTLVVPPAPSVPSAVLATLQNDSSASAPAATVTPTIISSPVTPAAPPRPATTVAPASLQDTGSIPTPGDDSHIQADEAALQAQIHTFVQDDADQDAAAGGSSAPPSATIAPTVTPTTAAAPAASSASSGSVTPPAAAAVAPTTPQPAPSAPSAASPPETPTQGEQPPHDTLLNNAVSQLSATEPADSSSAQSAAAEEPADAPSTPPAAATPQAVPSRQPVDSHSPETDTSVHSPAGPASPTIISPNAAAPAATAEEPERPRTANIDRSAANDNVTVVGKKVIQPPEGMLHRPSIDDLLAKEQAKEDASAGTASAPVVNGQSAPPPPPTSFDPNSISL